MSQDTSPNVQRGCCACLLREAIVPGRSACSCGRRLQEWAPQSPPCSKPGCVCVTRCGCVVVCGGITEDVCRCECAGVYRYHGMGRVGVHVLCTHVYTCGVVLEPGPRDFEGPPAMSMPSSISDPEPFPAPPCSDPGLLCPDVQPGGHFSQFVLGCSGAPSRAGVLMTHPQDSKGSLSLLRVTGPVADLPQHAVQVSPGACSGSASACAGRGSVPGVLAALMATVSPRLQEPEGFCSPACHRRHRLRRRGAREASRAPGCWWRLGASE